LRQLAEIGVSPDQAAQELRRLRTTRQDVRAARRAVDSKEKRERARAARGCAEEARNNCVSRLTVHGSSSFSSANA